MRFSPGYYSSAGVLCSALSQHTRECYVGKRKQAGKTRHPPKQRRPDKPGFPSLLRSAPCTGTRGKTKSTKKFFRVDLPVVSGPTCSVCLATPATQLHLARHVSRSRCVPPVGRFILQIVIERVAQVRIVLRALMGQLQRLQVASFLIRISFLLAVSFVTNASQVSLASAWISMAPAMWCLCQLDLRQALPCLQAVFFSELVGVFSRQIVKAAASTLLVRATFAIRMLRRISGLLT